MSIDWKDNLSFIDPKEHKDIQITGFLDPDKYLRIPEIYFNALEKENPVLTGLIRQTSGGMLKFKTDSPTLALKAKTTNENYGSGLTPNVVSGFDCYIYNEERCAWNYVNVVRSENEEEVLFFENLAGEKEIIIHFPLFAQVLSLKIGIDKKAAIKKPKPFSVKGRLVYYGTSLTQGANASRPGINYVSTISRNLNIETLNLGFSGNGLGEPTIRKAIREIADMMMLVIDYDANAGATGSLYTTLKPFISEVREYYPTLPIVIISRIFYILEDYSAETKNKMAHRRTFQKETVENLNESHIYYIDGKTLLPEKPFDCFSDQIHLNDLGFYWFSQNLTDKLKQILIREGVVKEWKQKS